jgi:hypothetical protein
MAPQALGIARNATGNGRPGRRDAIFAGEDQGAIELSEVAKSASLDANIFSSARDGVSAKGIAQRIEHDVSSGAQFAADQDNIGIKIIAEIADQAAHLPGGGADDALRADVSVQRHLETVLDADGTVSVTHRVPERVDGHFAF